MIVVNKICIDVICFTNNDSTKLYLLLLHLLYSIINIVLVEFFWNVYLHSLMRQSIFLELFLTFWLFWNWFFIFFDLATLSLWTSTAGKKIEKTKMALSTLVSNRPNPKHERTIQTSEIELNLCQNKLQFKPNKCQNSFLHYWIVAKMENQDSKVT